MNMEAGKSSIRPLVAEDAAACEDLLRSLPEWFGIEESIVAYGKSIVDLETWVVGSSRAMVGFITLEQPYPESAEIHVMAVRADRHREGIGRGLVTHAERLLAKRGVNLLQVKTLGSSRTNEFYARTRAFYHAMGFAPLEENNLWGEVNPCLIMVKCLGGCKE